MDGLEQPLAAGVDIDIEAKALKSALVVVETFFAELRAELRKPETD